MSTHTDWPARVRTLRRRLGLTQHEFASRVGARPLTVSRWERAAAVPSLRHERRLVKLELKEEGAR